MSAGNDHDLSAREYLGDGQDQMAIVHAVLAIRAELRTANLIAVLQHSTFITDHLDTFDAVQLDTTTSAVRDEIREELDLDDRP